MSEINAINYLISLHEKKEEFLKMDSLIKEYSKITPTGIIIGHGEELSKARTLALSMPEDIPIVVIDNNPTFVNPTLEMKIELFKSLNKEDYCFIKSPSRSKKNLSIKEI